MIVPSYLNPDLAVACTNRGVTKGSLGRHEEALADFDHAIRLGSNDTVTYINRGLAKLKLDCPDEARKDFKTALELARNAGNADLQAQVEQSLRDLDDAVGS